MSTSLSVYVGPYLSITAPGPVVMPFSLTHLVYAPRPAHGAPASAEQVWLPNIATLGKYFSSDAEPQTVELGADSVDHARDDLQAKLKEVLQFLERVPGCRVRIAWGVVTTHL